jgi:trans-2,3-dihydro-3-hydroxyanthranilate isomerase
MQQELDYYLLDVFTDVPFGGNPLAVFTEANQLSTQQMQCIARELNLSETVFLCAPTAKEADVKMRIFTPGMELPTAGHPTIGTAFLILATKLLEPKKGNELLLEQNIGCMHINFEKNGEEITELMMEQPFPKFEQTFKEKELVASLLNIDEEEIYENYPCRVVNCGNPFLIVPVTSLETVKKLHLNHNLWNSIIDELNLTGVMVFTLETEEEKSLVHSRMFAPHLGIEEDPATGSAHGPLAAYLHNYQLADVSKVQQCEQGFEMGRPSYINIQVLTREGKIDKVFIGGKSVIMGNGTLYHFE